MKKQRKIFSVIVVVTVIFVSFLIWRSRPHDTQALFTFTCANNKTISAIFVPQAVSLTLSGGRHLTLSQGISASGARYTNLDQSIVFWNKGNIASIEESGVATYKDCTVTP